MRYHASPTHGWHPGAAGDAASLDLSGIRRAVDSGLAAFLDNKSRTAVDGRLPAEVPRLLRRFLDSGGKHLRPLLCVIGWHAAGGHGDIAPMLKVAASPGTCPHSDHRRKRRLLQPAFHPARLPGYAQAMTARAAETTGSWQDGQILNVFAVMQELTARITADTLFSTARLRC